MISVAESKFDIIFERCFNSIIRRILKIDRDNYERYTDKIYEKYRPTDDIKRCRNMLLRISRWFIIEHSEFSTNYVILSLIYFCSNDIWEIEKF